MSGYYANDGMHTVADAAWDDYDGDPWEFCEEQDAVEDEVDEAGDEE